MAFSEVSQSVIACSPLKDNQPWDAMLVSTLSAGSPGERSHFAIVN